ncbi:mate efflux family protein [Zymoseptoria brevis]|uniref:Mate efflux family protein n=1 Tax=Zymoseptoria brevis TaxID=1047168 RepID=A0A0F4GLS5_9PEZI|nr:mate efflux family protein [Zymoseptoria brevis]
MTERRPIQTPRNRSDGSNPHSLSRSFGASRASNPGQSYIASIAEESVRRDLEGEDDALEDDNSQEVGLHRTPSGDLVSTTYGSHSMIGHFRRPSYIGATGRPFLGAQMPEAVIPVEQDWEAALSEERSLLRDNNIIPPKHPRRTESGAEEEGGLRRVLSMSGFSSRKKSVATAETAGDGNGRADETTGLLGAEITGRDPSAPYGGEDDPANIAKKWEEAVENGQIQTTWQRETKVLVRYAAPLILTFVLQTSLTLVSVFTVGHLGKIELGAVSLGSMTANITGYSVYHGLSTSLDTLCAQAYGSGKKKLVGLQLQRMIYFLWTITIPIAVVWLSATQILSAIIPEKETAVLAGQYLKVLIIGAPGYACFEASKRYVQAQGRFEATLYVLLFAAPLNVFLHWLLVWHLKWGFIGCPIAVVTTETLMPVLLFLYVRFVGGMECWPGFTRKAFTNWGPMIRLAIPGLIMTLAEFLAFEILTLASARISATHLAANTVLQSLSVLTYQLPFPLSIAVSTRVANLIGAGLPGAAQVTTNVAFAIGTFLGVFNMVALSLLRHKIPWLFSSEADVVALAAACLPVNAAFQLFDSLAAQCNGILRGLGKQEIGGYINLFAYYAIALPISFAMGFALHYDLLGLWAGPAIGLAIVSLFEGAYIWKTSFENASEEAARRNAAD